MTTAFDIRNLGLPKMSRSLVIGLLVTVLVAIAGLAGRMLYANYTTTTVVAYFPEANALYRGDEVRIMGVQVGSIDDIEVVGDVTKVTFHYDNKYKVPADASAVILNPTLVAARNIQLEPPYRGGAALADNAEIPIERTEVPTEWDELRNNFADIIDKLGPTPEEPKGPFGDVIDSFANGLAGKGSQINTTLTSLSRALTAMNEGRGDFFAVTRSLALFVNALHQDDQHFVALNDNLAELTDRFTHTDHDVAVAAQQLDELLPTLREFLAENREVLAHDVDSLADVTTRLVQPEPLDGLETTLHVWPTMFANALNMFHPANGGVAANSINFLGIMFANPMLFICSSIQAGSRMGYQDSAELCAEYLAPILDAIKFNYFPFSLNLFSTAAVLPKHLSYSEPRLQPPNGYKDTTVPGIWVPDTPLSHRNTQHGWITAPGMQGVRVGQVTRGLLTPESLAELMGGPDIEPVDSQYQTPPGSPNAYNAEPGPLPYVGLPPGQAPLPPPPPDPGVVQGPVPPAPDPRGLPPLPAEMGTPMEPGQ